MSNYTQSTNFATKDALSSGDPLKIVKGTEINTEFVNIAVAVATKADLASPTFSGNVTGTFVGNVTGNLTGNVTGNTSGTAANVTGTVIVANGGTGATSFTSGALLKGSGTSAVAVASAADIVAQIGSTAVANATTAANGGVTSVNGSTGAVSTIPSSISAIGAVLMAANTSTSNLLPGDTIAGSSLYYPSAITLVSTFIQTEGTSTNPITDIGPVNKYPLQAARKFTTGNTGYTVPGGHTALSGTWRILSTVAARTADYDSGTDTTSSYSGYVMAQRIS